MWNSNHCGNGGGHGGGNDCWEPNRNRCDDDRDRGRCDDNDRHHGGGHGGGGWRDQDCHDGGGHGFFNNNEHHGLSVFCH
jgi:hypothetical protein